MNILTKRPAVTPNVTVETLVSSLRPSGGPLSTVSADLLPDEVRTKRRLDKFKRSSVLVLAILVVLVVAGELLAHRQTVSADADLARANDQVSALDQQLGGFDAMLGMQTETQTIQTQLDGAMTNDVTWAGLASRLRGLAPAGLRISSIGGQVSGASAGVSAGSDTAPLPAGLTAVGTLTLSGTAPNWQAVAGYVNSLSRLPGLTSVNPETVAAGTASGTGPASGLTFTISATLTSAVLSNRYVATATPGPAAAAGSPTTAASSTPPATTSSSTPAASDPGAASESAPASHTASNGSTSAASAGSATSDGARRVDKAAADAGTGQSQQRQQIIEGAN